MQWGFYLMLWSVIVQEDQCRGRSKPHSKPFYAQQSGATLTDGCSAVILTSQTTTAAEAGARFKGTTGSGGDKQPFVCTVQRERDLQHESPMSCVVFAPTWDLHSNVEFVISLSPLFYSHFPIPPPPSNFLLSSFTHPPPHRSLLPTPPPHVSHLPYYANRIITLRIQL